MALITKPRLNFDQFLDQYPDGKGMYELVDGEIVEMRAIRWHDDIADFLCRQFNSEVDRLNLNDRVTGRLPGSRSNFSRVNLLSRVFLQSYAPFKIRRSIYRVANVGGHQTQSPPELGDSGDEYRTFRRFPTDKIPA
ncbi:MAG: hypothetical protein HC769_26885 [Cyanobacteria bacterium CRU_2_1]|nr:hypothetical protein [Cyanobacteria bacterium RU_5_0]NJR62131.1 hypothetical protein [Cyanobacteria bacterium CRU_2_1]